MLQFQVPQYVNIEDKLAFRLTLKQLGWFALGGFVLFLIWTVFEKWVFWLFFPFVLALSATFAFYKPAGLTLFVFLLNGIKHFFKPKQLVWNKDVNRITSVEKYGKRKLDTSKEEYLKTMKHKEKEIKNIDELVKILDEKSDL